jgi:uncharacterized integral membrane protein
MPERLVVKPWTRERGDMIAEDPASTQRLAPASQDQNSGSVEEGESSLARSTPSSRPAPTRLSGAWTAVVVTAIVLVAFVIFIAQNSHPVPIAYLGAHGHAPTAVIVLASAAAGALLVIAVGVARLTQLRRRLGTRRRPPGGRVDPPS